MSWQMVRLTRAVGALTLPIVFAAGCATDATAGYRERLERYRSLAPVAAPAQDADVEALRVLEGAAVLDRRALVEAVLARSPTLESARQAWRAALEEVPQVTAYDDPMLAYEVAPLSVPLPIPGRDVPFGHSLMLRQTLPFPGKLEARGAQALSSADVAQEELAVARLDLALLASELWADYYATARSLAVNEELTGLLAALRESAEAHLATGHALVRDPLKAEVSLAELERERVALEARQRVLAARLNGLLHRPPDAPLPPPPEEVPLPAGVERVQELEARALDERPEIASADAMLRGADAGLDLAALAYAPDVSLSGEYTSMFPMLEHQWMVGVGLSLPLQLARRQAEADAARARAARAEAERLRVVDVVRTEVAIALEREREARRVVDLYEERLLPAASGQLEAARASLEAGAQGMGGQGYFDVLDAEEDLRRARLGREVAVADLLKRRAELERALGEVPGLGAREGAER